jgi:1-deoxy-D-xylulose-5-phosphate synthase
MGLLENINGYDDLHKLRKSDLPALAAEIRKEIIDTVSANGGHLSSNLGVVELTIALHYSFDFMKDRLYFDVSHQCYTHKLLSGRAKNFSTLRKFKGVSGFQNRFESAADPFTVGHAGSILSAAVGTAMGDELAGVKRNVVVIIGDGAMSAGNTFEALNHAGALGKNILVVLNDNRMAIAETVGAMSNYLTRVRLAPSYAGLKREIYDFLNRVPVIGVKMRYGLDHLREVLRRSMIHGLMFEDLGFKYYGPIDGHDVEGMLAALEEVRRVDGPRLLHVVTEKGRGFKPATDDPEKFHGAQGFLCDDGKVPEIEEKTTGPSYTKVFGDALVKFAREDPKVAAITAAMPEGTGLCDFKTEFPARFVDVGICEQHAIGLAAGLASSGMKPVAAIYSTFLQRAYDQIFEMIALQKLHVVLAIDRAGLVGNDGPTHHGASDVAYLRNVPGMALMAPKDGAELELMLKFALALDGPAAVRYPRAVCPNPDMFGAPAPVELGKSEVLREGEGVCFLAYGSMAAEAEQAARILEKDGLKPGLVNARFAKPLDLDMLKTIAGRYKKIIAVEEGCATGGFGSAVLAALSGAGLKTDGVKIIGLPDAFVEHGSRAELLEICLLSAARLAETARKVLGN